MFKSLSTVALAASLVACASTQKAEVAPAPAPAPSVPAMVPHPYALPAQPARTVVAAPGWFVKMPDNTADMIFAVGTATSTDEQMAYDKARMAAERKLVEQMSSQVRTQTKSYKVDTGNAVAERFEQTVQKTANGELIGAQRVDAQATFDGRQYKVYVLLRYPLAENNVLRREREQARAQRETELRAARAQQELDATMTQQRQDQKTDEAQQRRDIGPVQPQSSAPATIPYAPTSVPTADGDVKLLQVDNAEYQRRRAEALEKPGAVIGNTTVR